MKRPLLSLISATFLAGSAYADDVGLRLAENEPGTIAPFSKSSAKALGKYGFEPSLSAELDVVDLGAGRSGTGLSTSRGFALTRGQSLIGTGTLPINESFSFFGQLGFARSDEDLQFSLGVPAYKYDPGSDLTYGVGLRYDFTERLGLRLQWERYNQPAFDLPDGDDVNLLSTGLRYRF